MICYSCKKDIPLSPSQLIGRRDECIHCGADLRICFNCAHYDKGAYNECKETQADVVQVKDRSNFCDHFTPGGTKKTGTDKNDLLSAAEALFKKK